MTNQIINRQTLQTPTIFLNLSPSLSGSPAEDQSRRLSIALSDNPASFETLMEPICSRSCYFGSHGSMDRKMKNSISLHRSQCDMNPWLTPGDQNIQRDPSECCFEMSHRPLPTGGCRSVERFSIVALFLALGSNSNVSFDGKRKTPLERDSILRFPSDL